jgi:hypothetical protein
MAQKANPALPPVGDPAYPPNYVQSQEQVATISTISYGYGYGAPQPTVTVVATAVDLGYPERKEASNFLISAAAFNLLGFVVLGSFFRYW